MADRNLEAQISVEFNTASSRQSLDSGDDIKDLFGKTKKWLEDLDASAFEAPPDISGKADKDNTVLTSSLSLGRKAETTVGTNSTVLGYSNTASAANSIALGIETEATGLGSHTEGYKTKASGQYSHAEGNDTTASAAQAHAEGSGTKATKEGTHAEGLGSTASGSYSHAEGNTTTASGDGSHAEGGGAKAIGQYSHAEGSGCSATGTGAHAEGVMTVTLADGQHAEGKYNIPHARYIEMVGNGSSDSNRNNASAIDWNGNQYLAGNLYVGVTNWTDPETTDTYKVATKGDIPSIDEDLSDTSINPVQNKVVKTALDEKAEVLPLSQDEYDALEKEGKLEEDKFYVIVDEGGGGGGGGTPGKDGFSPIVTITEIEGGHEVTITDKEGAKSFNVMDGEDVDEEALTENIKIALSNVYLALTGGTVTGRVDIHTSQKITELFKVTRDTWENNIIARVNGGHLVTGDGSQTSYCALGSIRKCTSDSNRVNSAAFYCNSDGTAIFTHKGGAMGVNGINNDAWMKFNQNGFQVSYSGSYNVSANEAYTLLDSHNIGDDATIKALIARIEALEAKV